MPARKGPKKVNRYSIEMKRTAVRLSNAPGARVMDVAEALDIHPFMLSRWRKMARDAPNLPVCRDKARIPAGPRIVCLLAYRRRRLRAGRSGRAVVRFGYPSSSWASRHASG